MKYIKSSYWKLFFRVASECSGSSGSNLVQLLNKCSGLKKNNICFKVEWNVSRKCISSSKVQISQNCTSVQCLLYSINLYFKFDTLICILCSQHWLLVSVLAQIIVRTQCSYTGTQERHFINITCHLVYTAN